MNAFTRLVSLPLAASAVVLLGAALPQIASADNTKTVQADISNYSCNSSEWKFEITKLDNQKEAPNHILVEFANGKEEHNVKLDTYANGTAYYVVTDNLDSYVTGTDMAIDVSWHGEFKLMEGPCETGNQQIPFAPAFAYPAIGAVSLAASYGTRKLRRRKA